MSVLSAFRGRRRPGKNRPWTGSPIIRLRTAGTVYTLLTIVLGVVAVNSGNNLLYLLTALLLGYMLASGVAGRRNVMGARAALELPDEIYAGIPFEASIRIENPRSAPLHMIEAAVRLEEGEGAAPRAFFGVVPPRGASSRGVVLTLPRRGTVRMALEVSSVFPFDFFTRFAWDRSWMAALAFPTPAPDAPVAAVGEAEEQGEASSAGSSRSDDASDAAGVRPYQTGDPVNRVHWKITARTGKLSTRLLEGEAPVGLVIDLDGLVRDGLEHGLSAAAGRILQAERESAPIGMMDRGTLFPPAAGRQNRLALLRRLALYEGAAR